MGPGSVGAVLVYEVSQVILRDVGEEGGGALGYFFVLSGGQPYQGVVEGVDEGLDRVGVGSYVFGHGGERAVADVPEFGAEGDRYVSRALGDERSGLGVREVNVVGPARPEGFDGILGGEAGEPGSRRRGQRRVFSMAARREFQGTGVKPTGATVAPSSILPVP